jgi:putative transposase
LTIYRSINAAAESWFATFKTELVYRIALTTKAFARRRIIGWIDRYNRDRRQSHCGLKSPLTYEKLNTPAAQAA